MDKTIILVQIKEVYKENWAFVIGILTLGFAFLLNKVVYPFYIKPYRMFKKELSLTKYTLDASEQKLTGGAKQASKLLNGEKEELLGILHKLRERWAKVEVSYSSLSNSKAIRLFVFLTIIRFPSKEEMKKFESNLLTLSNATLFYYQAINPAIGDTPEKRSKIVKEAKRFIESYC